MSILVFLGVVVVKTPVVVKTSAPHPSVVYVAPPLKVAYQPEPLEQPDFVPLLLAAVKELP